MPYKDPETKKRKHAEYSKKYYEANKEASKARVKKRKKERKVEWQEFKKTLSCINCGENHPATLDFHHIKKDPTNRKVHKLLQANNYGAAVKELERCVVLCANCHRKHHHEEYEQSKLTKKQKKKPHLLSGVKTVKFDYAPGEANIPSGSE